MAVGISAGEVSGSGEVSEGDGLVSVDRPGPVAVLVADCAAVALGSPEGIHGAVHAGWRGLTAGVVQHAVAAMRSAGASTVMAGLGACIRSCCYAFDEPDLVQVTERLGHRLRAATSDGHSALDLPAGVSAALGEAGAALVFDSGQCTACGNRHFSHRRWADHGRQALVVWTSGPPS